MSNSTSSKRPGCLDAAIDYAKRGFSVILLHGITNGLCTCGKPGCPSPGKHPIGKSWKRAQTERATPEELEAEFVRHPDANIGIVTGLVSGLVVADLDGEPGMSSLMSLLVGQEPPKVPAVRTGGGFHLYGRHPGAPLKNFVKTYPGLDGRADGGYVVAPPSIHVSGHEYKWTRPLVDVLPDLPPELLALFSAGDGRPRGKGSARKRAASATELLPPIPAQVGRLPRGMKRYAEAALGDECGLVAMATIGGQETTISTAGLKIGRYVGAGLLDFVAARDALVAAGLRMVNDRQRTPWTANELRVKSRGKAAEGHGKP